MIYLLILTFILAPTYVIRFSFFNLPLNLLMIWIFFVWMVFGFWLIINKTVRNFINFKLSIDKKILIPISLFFLAGIISLFVGGADRAKLGQFIVLFLQPISLFFIAGFIFKKNPKSKHLIFNAAYITLALCGLYAILQYFTLLGLPAAYWGNSLEPKRALSFFVHPNFYALWSAPLLAFLIPDVFANLKSKIINLKSIAWTLGALGLLLTLSRAGWLGLAATMGAYLIVAADKKTRKIILGGVIVIVMIIVYYPNLRYRFIGPFYGEKSANSRVELWQDGIKAIKQSPVFGLGLTGFAKNYGQLNDDKTLDTHNFPHNIFLNLWVETGLLGLVSFIGLIALLIYRGVRAAALLPRRGEMSRMHPSDREVERLNYDQMIKLSISLFLIALLFQGLVDNPYFKNDLALIFWIILALAI